MVLIVMMMIMLCLADGVSVAVLGLMRRWSAPRARIARARQYRFN